jgi:protein-S-isoprenylcysteine O-methyltransferase Ste14
MAEAERSPLDALRDEAVRLGADLREMALARWQLVRLEVEAATADLRRLAVVLAVAATCALSALPLAAFCLAETLDQCLGIPRVAWLGVFGAFLLGTGLLTGWLGWRRFRREFTGLQETLEELHEDGVWLREWLERKAES